jgi:hypothetical protein
MLDIVLRMYCELSVNEVRQLELEAREECGRESRI